MKHLCVLLAAAASANAQFFIDTYAGRYTPPLGSTSTAVSLFNDDLPSSVTPYPTVYPLIAADGQGNKYLVPLTPIGANQIIQLDSNNLVKQVIGTITPGFAGDGSGISTAQFDGIRAIAADSAGNLYIADNFNARIRKIDTLGRISTVCGVGTSGYSGDGGLAQAAQISLNVQDLAVDSNGNLYVADTGNNRIRKVAGATGIISTVAGDGDSTSSGDGGPAIDAGIFPANIAVDSIGNIYLTEKVQRGPSSVTVDLRWISGTTLAINTIPVSANWSLDRVRADPTGRVLFTSRSFPGLLTTTSDGTVTIVAGETVAGYSGDGSVATAATFGVLRDLASDPSGNLYLVDYGNFRIRRIAIQTNIVSTVAGNGSLSYSGDGGLALNAQMTPSNLAVDVNGSLYAADTGNYRLRRVDAISLEISTIAGNGQAGSSGDGGPATAATLAPTAVAVDSLGNVYISDAVNNRVRKIVATTGTISTIAGNGTAGFSGDGGPATAAELNQPGAIAVDAAGNVYIADYANNCVRKVNASTGTILTVINSGNLPGSLNFSTSYPPQPTGLAVDDTSNLYVSLVSGLGIGDIVKLTPAGVVSLYAGNGTNTGEEIPGVGAQLLPSSMTIDSAGNLFYTEQYPPLSGGVTGLTVRRIDASTQLVSTAAGMPYTSGYSGDGGPALTAELDLASSVVASGQNIYVMDGYVVRRLYSPTGSTIVTSVPSGLALIADGVPYNTPAIFEWLLSSGHTVSVATPQILGNSSYAFQDWQDGLTSNQRTIVVASNTSTTYTAIFSLTPVALNPATLPAARLSAAYGYQIMATGGVLPYAYQLTGGALPAGMMLTNGVVNGTPAAAGEFNFVITVTDAENATANAQFDLSVGAAGSFNAAGNFGVFRLGQWWLDISGDHQWTSPPDQVFVYGQQGDIPIIGDWTNTGSNSIGIFRSGQWWLDINGDGQWTAGIDMVFTYGQAGDIPIVGDWDNTGVQRIGVFRNGQWWLDMNNDHLWTSGFDAVFTYGQAGDVPVIGDWDNTGVQRIGVFRNGEWWLDINNDHRWTSAQDAVFIYGQPGDVPILGDWTQSGAQRIGVFRHGQWWIDINNDHQWTSPADALYIFGQTGDVPVPGK